MIYSLYYINKNSIKVIFQSTVYNHEYPTAVHIQILGYNSVNVTHLWPEYCQNAKNKPHLFLLLLLSLWMLLLRLHAAAAFIAVVVVVIAVSVVVASHFEYSRNSVNSVDSLCALSPLCYNIILSLSASAAHRAACVCVRA